MHSSITIQVCYRCHIEKLMSAFISRIDKRYYNMCRVCVSEILCQSRVDRKREKLQHTETHQTCYLCRRFLPVEEFTRRSNGTFFSACKDCNRHVFNQRRRARLKQSQGSYTRQEWEALVAQYKSCLMCLRPWGEIPLLASGAAVITVDHVVPISKGGSNTIDNVQPLCYSCNSKKETKLMKTPLAHSS